MCSRKAAPTFWERLGEGPRARALTSASLARDLRLRRTGGRLGRMRPRPPAWSLRSLRLPRREAPPLTETPRAASRCLMEARKHPAARCVAARPPPHLERLGEGPRARAFTGIRF